MIIIVVVLVILRGKNARGKSESNHENIEAAIMLRRYSYKKVEKMTNSFAHVVGKGGFGTVYKGKLPDAGGRDIAIKILNNESKGSGEDFINELASCVSRIVHFDIKPQNILIDKDFCPKISDFGLAKLCKNKESIISMLDARGIAGYISTEVYSKNFGGASHKSDVYSYGIVVLEMIGATKEERAETSQSNISTSYFLDWVYENLEMEETMRRLGDYVVEEEAKIEKKLTLVGLWCIQTNPFDRPPMRKVIEMLEGSLEGIEVPPKSILNLRVVKAWEYAEHS